MSNELERSLDAPDFLTTAATIPIRKQTVANLVIPSGQIIACDPGAFQFEENQRPFHRTVPPGTYPVTVGLVQSGRFEIPAYLMIEFTREPPVQWALATRSRKRTDAATSAAHLVDSGCSCFMDAEAALQIAADWEKTIYRGRLLGVMLEALPPRPWAAIVLNSETGANLVACTSGYGDGSYSSFWGVDALGAVNASSQISM